jgi:hypothetical protein
MAHRIKIKLGDAEFEAEGAEDKVQAQYEQFLAAMERAGAQPAKPKPRVGDAQHGGGGGAAGGNSDQLGRIFEFRQDGLIVFRVHPPETMDQADVLALLLLGYRKLGDKNNVLSTQLSRSARQSGLGDVRIDLMAQPHIPRFILRGGQRKGTTYTLTTQGETRAQEVAAAMPV